jgi:hypothetical protein
MPRKVRQTLWAHAFVQGHRNPQLCACLQDNLEVKPTSVLTWFTLGDEIIEVVVDPCHPRCASAICSTSSPVANDLEDALE